MVAKKKVEIDVDAELDLSQDAPELDAEKFVVVKAVTVCHKRGAHSKIARRRILSPGDEITKADVLDDAAWDSMLERELIAKS